MWQLNHIIIFIISLISMFCSPSLVLICNNSCIILFVLISLVVSTHVILCLSLKYFSLMQRSWNITVIWQFLEFTRSFIHYVWLICKWYYLCIGLMMASMLYERAARIEHTCHHQTYLVHVSVVTTGQWIIVPPFLGKPCVSTWQYIQQICTATAKWCY